MAFRTKQAQVQISALSYPTPINFSLSNIVIGLLQRLIIIYT